MENHPPKKHDTGTRFQVELDRRSKEDAEDYRYFPEPDLVPLNPSAAELKLIKDGLPNLSAQRRKNLMDILGSDANDAVILVEREHDAFAVDAIELGGVKESIAKYLINNLADGMGDLSPKALAELTQMEANGDVTSTQARKILVELVANGGAPGEIAEHLGLETIDADAIGGFRADRRTPKRVGKIS